MAVLCGATFTGLEHDASGVEVGGAILAPSLITIAQDQGFVFETLTGQAASDGTSAAATATPHDHSEAGNLIYRCLMSQAFGTEGSSSNPYDVTIQQNQQGLCIQTDASSTPESKPVVAALLYVPSGFEDKDLIVVVDTAGGAAPRMTLDLYDDTWTPVTGYTGKPLRRADLMTNLEGFAMMRDAGGGPSIWGAPFQVPTPGVYVLKLSTVLEAQVETRYVRSMHVFAETDPTIAGNPQAPVAETIAGVVVGNPDDSNKWHPVDANLIALDSPLNAAALTILAHNNALLMELATDLPATGKTSKTVTKGHDHSAAALMGGEIAHVYWSNCWGSWDSGATGNNSTSIRSSGTTSYVYAVKTRIWLPKSENIIGGTDSKLNVVLLMMGENKADGGTAKVTVNAASQESAVAYAGALQIITFATPFSYASASTNVLNIEIKCTSAAGVVHLIAGVAYIAP